MAPSTIHQAVAATLERAINEALNLDDRVRSRLLGLSGRTVQIRCSVPEFTLFIAPTDAGVNIMAWHEGACDCRVSGPASAYLALLTADDKPSALINGELQVSGDTSALLDLQEALQSLDVDWEGRLAEVIGDVPAHQLGRALRGGARWGQHAHNSLLRHIEEFIHEEARLAPSKAEVNDFLDDLRAMDNRLERLSARLRSLNRRVAQKSQQGRRD